MGHLQLIKNKPRILRLLSYKSAADISAEVCEEMVDALIEKPDPESITRKFGSTAIQVVFSILWVLACRLVRMERLMAKQNAARRDGYGSPKIASIDDRPVRMAEPRKIRACRALRAA